MSKFKVMQNYKSSVLMNSSMVQLGPWGAGDKIELEDDRAEFVNRDAPGTLVEAGAAASNVENLNKLAVGALRARLKALGLDTEGKKAELVKRLGDELEARQIKVSITDRMERGEQDRGAGTGPMTSGNMFGGGKK